ncbi:Lon protease [Clostridium tepidiprofundi DSM 19306]|uniref:endopeptidase La n=1 Tax=Clostridium tepidiprofundi DSM 19306 TaxID=1121338 RepID=A0A151B6W3_9CLOT|nr:AAA family ATPase [Clostridium tepidiprofundi]KYH35646.1 Lon protease [Clostridium tepidiprofundi DSM 19306]
MFRELKAEEVIYDFSLDDIDFKEEFKLIPEYKDVYSRIKTAINIEKTGFNVFLIDDFSNEKLDNLIEFIKNILKGRHKPRDVCYIILEDSSTPVPMYIENGKGILLKESIKKIQKCYDDIVYDFYNNTTSVEKEKLLNFLEKSKSALVSELIISAKKDNFDIKPSGSGFTFIPLKDDRVMTENEYDELSLEEKEKILNKVSELKSKAKNILNKLKDLELNEIEKLKKLLSEEISERIQDIKFDVYNKFSGDEYVLEYIKYVCDKIENELVENYSSLYEDDEIEIKKIIYKYKVNVIVDNSEMDSPRVVYEDDPSLSNLLGTIEFENIGGSYISSIDLIKAGSLINANDGCLIVRLNNLLTYPSSYYYLKKSILTGKVDLNYNKGYLDLLMPTNFKPEPIKIDEKVIVIGDYRSYELLFSYDEDFRKIFKINAESSPFVKLNKKNKEILLNKIVALCKQNNYKPLTNEAVKEISKYLSRKAESKNKIYFSTSEISKILTIANQIVDDNGENSIDYKDIINAAYPEELIEKEMFELYENKKILFSVEGKCVGKINGLSVIDTGTTTFGRPFRITCSTYKGEGNIIDVQKESNLSGSIHDKAINTLKGFIYTLIGGYDKLSVDFHLSFEQIYGLVDGDSASVAEIISMISALSKIPINQNIAVTGSINQFGEVQPIGGVNEKIEGFFKACKLIDKVEGKGVLIPKTNKYDLVLNYEVEQNIINGNFKIYTMENINDAIDVLMGDENLKSYEIIEIMKKEMMKYSNRKRKK